MTRSKAHSVVSLLVVIAVCSFTSASLGDDWDLLQGKWQSVSWTRKKTEAKLNPKLVWVYERGKMTAFDDGKETVAFRLKLNEAAHPKEYDLYYEGDDPYLKEIYLPVVRGIYEIDGDTLRRCYRLHSGERPTKFDGDSEAVLQVFKRAPADTK